MILIATSRQSGGGLTQEAAAILEVSPLDVLSALAGELVRQIELGSVMFQVPSLPEFRAIMGLEGAQAEAIVEAFGNRGRHFKL